MSDHRENDRKFSKVLFLRLSFLLLIFINLQEAFDVKKGVFFIQDEKTKGYRLENHMLRKLTSASIIDCGLQCAIEDGCKSINYKKTSPSKTPDNCELNAATASISDKPKHLIKDGMFSYYELFNLEKVVSSCHFSSCQNGATCDLESGQCKCLAGFTGKSCSTAVGSVREFPSKSCSEIKSYRLNATSGTYWIQPLVSSQNASQNSTSQDALQVFCDMETYGGGWTLVYSYTFTNYENFYDTTNAVTPRPSWPALLKSVPISKTAPLNETVLGAMDYKLWGHIGEEFMVKSNINHWIICQPRGGSFVAMQSGKITCRNIKNVVPACEGVAPSYIRWRLCGPRIIINMSIPFFNFDVATNLCYPSHNPCDKLSSIDIIKNVPNPGGAVFLR